MKNIQVASRAVIVVEEEHQKKLITIKRTIFQEHENKIYYTFPGGHVEDGESFEQTVIREVIEELGIKVKIIRQLAELFLEDIQKQEKFFLCEYESGMIGTGTGEEFTKPDFEKYGKYEIELIDIQNLESYPLLPQEMKQRMIKEFK